ncbi:MAG: hypothetical protein DMG68_03705 [Acidobacteria bacterium]|nr:MAG: hypothetical protein DMG68_03705 [Acidobacteriota bacterium]
MPAHRVQQVFLEGIHGADANDHRRGTGAGNREKVGFERPAAAVIDSDDARARRRMLQIKTRAQPHRINRRLPACVVVVEECDARNQLPVAMLRPPDSKAASPRRLVLAATAAQASYQLAGLEWSMCRAAQKHSETVLAPSVAVASTRMNSKE